MSIQQLDPRTTKVEMAAKSGAAQRSLRAVVFLGSVREGRMGDRVAKFVVKQLEAAKFTVDLFGTVLFALSPVSLFCTCINAMTLVDACTLPIKMCVRNI